MKTQAKLSLLTHRRTFLVDAGMVPRASTTGVSGEGRDYTLNRTGPASPSCRMQTLTHIASVFSSVTHPEIALTHTTSPKLPANPPHSPPQ